MKTIISKLTVILSILALIAIVARAHFDSAREKSRYPNELPNFQFYAAAKWKSIVPYVSTRDDVERLMGAPAPVHDQRFYVERLHGYQVGYDHDPDWIIIVSYIGEGGSSQPSLVGRVSHISLYPRKRISLGVEELPQAFTRSTYQENETELIIYSDKFGLRYSVYSKVAACDGRHAGDLDVIRYGVSDDEERRLTEP